jgi:uncharacterized protein (DUF1810 family)
MDKYDLQRFLYEQSINHDVAKEEILSGKKRQHWMWYTFPQLLGLGESKISVYYAIKSIAEAKAYIQNDTLRSNIVELCTLLIIIPQNDPSEVFCYPDDMKLRSSMTLFELVAPEIPVFGEVLEKFFGGERDGKTVEIFKEMQKDECP